MAKKYKKIDLSVFLPVLLICLLIFTVFSLAILSKISLFIELKSIIYRIVIVCCFVLSLVVSVIFSFNFKKEHSIVWFFKKRLISFFTSLLFLLLFVLSIHKELLMDANYAANLLGIEWAIFAISVGSFAVWHGLVFKSVYKPHEYVSSFNKDELSVENEIKKFIYFSEMNSANFDYVNNGDSITYIIINMISMCLATAACFLTGSYSVLGETIIIFALYCCTNTLINIMMGIIASISKQRKELIKATRVSPTIFNDTFDNIKALTFITLMDEMDQKIKFDMLDLNDIKLKDFFRKCKSLIDDYRIDKNSVLRNKKEAISLIDQLFRFSKQLDKETLKKETLLKSELKKLKKAISKYNTEDN